MARTQRPHRQPFSVADGIVIAGIVMLVILNAALVANYFHEQSAMERAARESSCSLAYARYSTEWQNCIDAR